MGRKRNNNNLFDICKRVKKDDASSWSSVRKWLESYEISEEIIAYYQNEYDKTPLRIILSENPPPDVLETLKAKVPEMLSMRNSDGSLPIHDAVFYNASSEVVKWLIQAYPEGVKVQNKAGLLPIHWAYNNEETAKLLIEEYPEGVRVQDEKGDLPIHWACCMGASVEVINLLIQAYRDGVRVTNNDGCLPIHDACDNSVSLKALDALVQAYPESTEKRCNAGKTPSGMLREKGIDLEDHKGRMPSCCAKNRETTTQTDMDTSLQLKELAAGEEQSRDHEHISEMMPVHSPTLADMPRHQVIVTTYPHHILSPISNTEMTVMPPADPAVLQPQQLSDQTETHDMSSEERREREAAGIRQQQSNGPYTFYAPAASNAATIAQPNESMMAQIAELQNIALSNKSEISQLKAMLKQVKDELSEIKSTLHSFASF